MRQHGSNCLSIPVPSPREDQPVPLDAPGVRRELVERIRREIAAGTYDTPEKLDAALERLLQTLEWVD